MPTGNEIRRDLVAFEPLTGRSWPDPPSGIFSTAGVAALCELSLCEDRMVFAPSPRVPRLLNVPVAILLNAISLSLFLTYPALRRTQRFTFAEITTIRAWTPQLGGPVIFQIGNDGWSYRLARRAWPVRFASADETSEHYSQVMSAWERNRGN